MLKCLVLLRNGIHLDQKLIKRKKRIKTRIKIFLINLNLKKNLTKRMINTERLSLLISTKTKAQMINHREIKKLTHHLQLMKVKVKLKYV